MKIEEITTSNANCVRAPVPEYAVMIYSSGGQMVVAIRYDGSVKYGPGFTTTEAAALEFWSAVGEVVGRGALTPDKS